ncbi:hypothetical protein [Pseudomonas sp. IT-P176]|uniref:hypothetical protein n=1 Tax=Pseudomonas sp. IT-P176 TaxID=3026444 RepID=UPI0039E0E74A
MDDKAQALHKVLASASVAWAAYESSLGKVSRAEEQHLKAVYEAEREAIKAYARLAEKQMSER